MTEELRNSTGRNSSTASGPPPLEGENKITNSIKFNYYSAPLQERSAIYLILPVETITLHSCNSSTVYTKKISRAARTAREK